MRCRWRQCRGGYRPPGEMRAAGLGGLAPARGLFPQGMRPPFSFWSCPKRECAAPGGREKAHRRVGLRRRRPPAAGGGWLALPCRSQGRKRPTLGETFGPGKFGIHPAPLFAAAGRLLMKAAAWANTTAPTPAGGARSEAERAERGAGQMRSCNPLTSAPAPRESAVNSLRHPAAPVGEPSRIRRHHLTSTPVARGGLLHRSALSALFFWTVHGPFSFRARPKRKWGVHCPAGNPAESPGRLITAPTTS